MKNQLLLGVIASLSAQVVSLTIEKLIKKKKVIGAIQPKDWRYRHQAEFAY